MLNAKAASLPPWLTATSRLCVEASSDPPGPAALAGGRVMECEVFSVQTGDEDKGLTETGAGGAF